MAKIGVYDSGLGGLSVVRKILDQTQGHSIIYLGDTAHLPYGGKSVDAVKNLSQKAFNFLLTKDVDLIVVACNTVSSVALPYLKEIYKIPVIGVVESGVEAAIKSGKENIGIIGTHNTIKSKRYDELLISQNKNIKIVKKECPLFVPLVEEGIVSGPIARLIVEKYLKEFKGNIDALILACTHYPALRDIIDEYFEEKVEIVDASMKIVSYINKFLNTQEDSVNHRFYVTDRADNFKKLSRLFLDKSLGKIQVVDIL